MRRRTKIVATLGPATDSDEALTALLNAGADVLRVNFSHGSVDDHEKRVERARAAAKRMGRDVGVLGDLQGPKIRIRRFKDGKINLANGAPFVLDTELPRDEGDETQVGITYPTLPQDVRGGDVLLLDDGQIVLEVVSVAGTRVACTVVQGGKLSDNKGINRQGGGLSASALTDKDREDILHAARMKLDYVALSFPRDARDVIELRRLLREAGGEGFVVAKIERAEAVENLDEILLACDVAMVARGDLGVEIGDAELPGVQKTIISRARALNRVTITATQMMESMITNPIPTRAEVSDVANAVIDGTDAVMLSAETATGAHPIKAVQSMARICEAAERQRVTQISQHRVERSFDLVDEAIAMATMYTANHFDVKAIVALTESGSTTLWLSRIRSGRPIYAFTRHEATRRRVTLYRGVYPVPFDVKKVDERNLTRHIAEELIAQGVVARGERVILTRGALSGISGKTNTMKIIEV
ncbi:MAG: pyruvate kinase [Gammaproteobacteria bacterium]